MVSGAADEVARGLDEIFGWGAAEVLVTILVDDSDMRTRTVEVLGELSSASGALPSFCVLYTYISLQMCILEETPLDLPR